jgi:uroporphyrin-III C-methyltransferase
VSVGQQLNALLADIDVAATQTSFEYGREALYA